MKNEATGLNRIIKAAGYSRQGIFAAYRNEAAFRQEVWLALVLTPLSFFIAGDPIEWILLFGSVLLVLVVELLNSGIEAVVDRLGEDWNELSGRAKDMGSAAVLLSLILLTCTWLAVIIH
ncbi:MAG: diacylglycerol kinase [Granulosicoccus sp.]|nr:diacylglycerol kinase [Granulosicoccus sp.]